MECVCARVNGGGGGEEGWDTRGVGGEEDVGWVGGRRRW